MARIRSTHPGQATDEDFVELSPFARLLAIHIRNEADDQGVFEWKPTTIKMRVFPADNVDVEALLAECEVHKQIKKFEHQGQYYGVIRNFRVWQRPKKPNSQYPLPIELRTYVGLEGKGSEPTPPKKPPSSEPTPPEAPPSSEISPQMEGGGGRREEVTPPPPNGGSPPRGMNAELLAIPENLDRRPADKRGTRLPEDWELPPDWEQWAVDEGHPNPQREAQNFKDHWLGKAGKDGRKVDWFATWRNWVRRSFEFGETRQNGHAEAARVKQPANDPEFEKRRRELKGVE